MGRADQAKIDREGVSSGSKAEAQATLIMHHIPTNYNSSTEIEVEFRLKQ